LRRKTEGVAALAALERGRIVKAIAADTSRACRVDDWLECPNCDEPVKAPDLYGEASGLPYYAESDGECPTCWALWSCSIEEDGAVMTAAGVLP
jgi:hypothetical protein